MPAAASLPRSAALVGPHACPCLPHTQQALLSWTTILQSLHRGSDVKVHSLRLHPLETKAICLHRHSAAFVLALKCTWGETGNTQPEMNAGLSLSGAVRAHVKLKPVTKLYFN